ncbi:MAG: tRNA (adenosine(37)-N6)-dimethylallyltransferase MiaA [Deltaproteobacteria bacterium]|nr:tRNA (adenosine(37)-N6)-dimethylallyltransferase MiaA [Deltaproteobacteria bacterium]MBW2395164.1 tRNA (adenosine(37)-N6)-dimethylallyltransferase MiaA [Deltaproteobacteria bacterium]
MSIEAPREAPPSKADVVVVAGPTAAGKTALAIELAERFGGEIVNADSQQVYRFMDVGTAKPSAEERARVPHHVIDVVTPDIQYHAARFEADARSAASRIRARGKRIFLVGGTGLYVRAFLDGLSAAVPRNPALREELEAFDQEHRAAGDANALHERLAKVDPASAKRLHPNDRIRLIRAIEVFESTGRPASEQSRQEGEPRERALHLAIDPGREELIARIDRRCEAMLEGGLLQEARELRERGYGPELPSMRAIGYRHMQPVIEGREILANVLQAMKHDTRQFARRQRTWLRGVAGVRCFHPDSRSEITQSVAEWLEADIQV